MANFVSHSSSVGRLWVHLSFKVKYCHKIFDIPRIKACMEHFMKEAMKNYGIEYDEIGIDSDHVHMVLDLGVHSVSHATKLLKGYTAKKLFHTFPWLKRQYFWGSGLWNPSYYFDSLGRDKEELVQYVKRQGQPKTQTVLTEHIN